MNKLIRSSIWPLFAPCELEKMLFERIKEPDTGFPRAEIKVDNENEQLIIQLALAGYPKDALTIEVADNVITVKANKIENSDHLFAGRAFTWSRYDANNIWDFDNSEVKYEDGMLTIKTLKREKLKAKLLKIS